MIGKTFKKAGLLALSALVFIGLAGCTSKGNEKKGEEAANLLQKIKEQGYITMVTSPDYPPYEFEDLTKTGQEAIVGADIDLAKSIAVELGVDLKIEPMGFDACLAAMGEGKADIMIAGMVPKEERLSLMDFSSTFNNDGDQAILILKENADKYKSLSDLKGESIAAQNGSLQYELVEEQLKDSTATPITEVSDAILMLKNGKVAGVAIATVSGDNYISNNNDLAYIEEKFVYESLGTVVGVAKDEPELLEIINAVVEKAEESGQYAKWLEAANGLSNELSK